MNGHPGRRSPTYLRVLVTGACPMRCRYCHAEGESLSGLSPEQRRGLCTEDLKGCLETAVRVGIRKFKFLGGEPLLRTDLPEVIAHLRRLAPDADLSLITAGVALRDRIEHLFEHGLDRANLTVHGFGPEAFARRGGTPHLLRMRDETLEFLVRAGRPLKLNYVYGGPEDDGDLRLLLDRAADCGVLVNVLDDLSDPCASARTVTMALRRAHGEWLVEEEDRDPHSLPTTRLEWPDGLRVEVKTASLGAIAPWKWCGTCAQRPRCREGIFALRLGVTGNLRLCMDRPDLALPLADVLRDGTGKAAEEWDRFLERSAA